MFWWLCWVLALPNVQGFSVPVCARLRNRPKAVLTPIVVLASMMGNLAADGLCGSDSVGWHCFACGGRF